jgi:cysteine desulfurase
LKTYSLNKPIYLDYAATTPMAEEAIVAMMPYLKDFFANPASLQHELGEKVHDIVEQARFDIAALLNAKPNDLIFTSGATEANNLAIKGIAFSYSKRGKHIITSAIEHKSVLDTCKYLETQGFTVSFIRPNAQGLIELDTVLNALTNETLLVSLMHVNNENGVINNIESLANHLKERDIFFHVDAAQSVGKLPIDLTQMPIDLLSLSAHKFYGAKGMGCLYIRNRKKTLLTPLLHGGGQEYGLRSGTLATHQIIAMATAFKIAYNRMTEDTAYCKKLEQLLIKQLNQLDGIYFNGDQQNKLPNILNISFENVSSDSLLLALKPNIALSSGSACNSGVIEASHVLRAMGIEGDRLYGAVRLSFGRYTTESEIKQAGQAIIQAVTHLRELANVG